SEDFYPPLSVDNRYIKYEYNSEPPSYSRYLESKANQVINNNNYRGASTPFSYVNRHGDFVSILIKLFMNRKLKIVNHWIVLIGLLFGKTKDVLKAIFCILSEVELF
ncbi:hypothetical protein ILUMI_20941, partial [Ignelater luminosus]